MGSFMQDVRYAVRTLAKSPGFTLVIVLTLALGIGANTAIFSIVNAVLLRPLPYAHADRIVFLSESSKEVPSMSISMADFNDWRARNTVFESMVAYQTANVTLTGQGQPQELSARRITAGLFSTLGVKPILGRPLSTDDDKVGAAPVALISDMFWSTQFSRDPHVLGQQIDLNGEQFTIIGVLPSSHFHESWRAFQVFTSLWRLEDKLGGPARRDDHPGIFSYALLKPGVTVDQARAQLVSIADSLAREYPQFDQGTSATVQPLLGALVQDVRPPLFILMGAVGFVLLIACANVVNLFMARSTERQREVSIRKALGASAWRIARQLLTESVLLSFCGGGLGLLVTLWATQGFAAVATGAVPRIGDVRVDGWVLVFTLAICLFTGIFFGVFPVLHASRTDVNDALKENTPGGGTGRARNSFRSALVVAELAISLVLLVGAGLTVQSLLHVLRANNGFNTDGVLTARFSLPGVKYKTNDQRRQFVAQLTERLAAIPGVEAAGVKNPLLGGWQSNFLAEGHPVTKDLSWLGSAEFSRVTPGALPAMGANLLRGRFFTASDNENAGKVCIVDDALAQKYWPGRDPIGKHVFIDEPKPGEAPSAITIVGEIRQIKNYGADQPVLPEIVLPFAQRPGSGGYLVIRSAIDPGSLASEVREASISLDPDLPIFNVRPLASFVTENVSPRLLSVTLLALFASLALVLAAVGIYGVISYSVTQRFHEIGIRMALGASSRDVLRLIVAHGLRLVTLGVVVGIIAAFALTRLLATLLFGVSATDPLTFAGVVAILAAVALFAGYIPARRASKMDPLAILRYE